MIKFIVQIAKILHFAWKVSIPFTIIFAICSFIIFYLKIDIGKINDNDFLFNFFGILLGFALTIFSFIISLIEKIKDSAELTYNGDLPRIERMRNAIKTLYGEIKDDIGFTFISLVSVCFFYVYNHTIPSFHLLGNYYFSYEAMVQAVKLSLFVLNIYAIYDLIIISFKLSDTTGIFDLPNKTP